MLVAFQSATLPSLSALLYGAYGIEEGEGNDAGGPHGESGASLIGGSVNDIGSLVVIGDTEVFNVTKMDEIDFLGVRSISQRRVGK